MENRKSLTDFYREQDIDCEWHYMDIDDAVWHENIQERNTKVLQEKGGSDYYLDEGLMEKLMSKWETPSKEEIDVWVVVKR